MNKQDNSLQDYNIINIKVDNKEQVISKFSYNENDKLNKELSEFILDKTKLIPLNKDININFHTTSPIEQQEIKNTLQNYFKEEYIEAQHELKRSNIVSLIMLILGVLALSVLVLAHKFFNYFYFTTILEISAWVFVWEAVDIFFLQRSKIRRKCLLLKKLYSAHIEVYLDN